MNANNDPLGVPICLPFCGADRREGPLEFVGRQTDFFPLAALGLWAQVIRTVQRTQSSARAKTSGVAIRPQKTVPQLVNRRRNRVVPRGSVPVGLRSGLRFHYACRYA